MSALGSIFGSGSVSLEAITGGVLSADSSSGDISPVAGSSVTSDTGLDFAAVGATRVKVASSSALNIGDVIIYGALSGVAVVETLAVVPDGTATSESDFDTVFAIDASGVASVVSNNLELQDALGNPLYAEPVSGVHGITTVALNGFGRRCYAYGAGSTAEVGYKYINTSGAVAYGLVQLNGLVTQVTATDIGYITELYYGSIASPRDFTIENNTAVRINGSYVGGHKSIPSATALVLTGGQCFTVTGTTSITSITATDYSAGDVVHLKFDGILTFTDGNNLKLAGNLVTSADDTISLMYNGTNWYELARSVN